MKKICIYGKGGIGKSTTVANLAASCAKMGYKVAIVGCDPKADSTRNVMGKRIPAILSIIHEKKDAPLCQTGFMGIKCMESGGPLPATGCAGRGIVVALKEISSRKLLEDVDIVFYDVLGDVVCGGFATPLRENVADLVYIVSTSDYMSLYAANNISKGIEKYAKTGTIKLGGIIHNGRSSIANQDLVAKFTQEINSEVVGFVPMSAEISKAEMEGKTVVEYDENCQASQAFEELAKTIINKSLGTIPKPMEDEELEALCWSKK